MPDPAALRAGDWLLVYQRRGVQYDASRKSLRFDNGAEVSADLRLSGGGSALFAIL